MFQLTCLLLAMFCASAASPEKVLIPGFAVGSKKSDVITEEWKLVSESNVDDGVRPKFHHQVFAIGNRTTFDVPARVNVKFYNDMMLEIVLCPLGSNDLAAIRDGVASMHQLEAKKLPGGVRSGGLEVQEMTDIRGQTYISIKVERVYEEYQNWILAYS